MKAKTKLHRLLSALLCLVMVLGMLPTTAFASGDYEDGENCPYCGSYNWGDWKCDGCGGCSADSGRTSCYEEHHCQDCGKCLWEEDEYVTISIPHGSYPISVIRGMSYGADGKVLAGGTVGQTITIKANQEENKKFDHWKVISGGVTLADPNARETTFQVVTITPHEPALYSDYYIEVEAVFTTCTHTGSTHTDGAIDATCGANGKTADTICDECGAVVTPGTLIYATGEHDFQIDPATVKEGSCTRSGYSGDYVCVVCGKDGERGEYTGKVHVNTEVVGARDATCTAAGHTGKTVCSDCGAVVSRGESIPKKEHTFGEWVVTVQPGFDREGKQTRTCTACGKTESQTLPATGKYTVKFDSNGGSEVAAQSVAPNATAVRPANPSKSGSVFLGWFTNKALTKEYDFSTPVTENLTLYAGWEIASAVPEEYTVTVLDDGNGTASASPAKAKAGDTVTLTAVPNSGYRFKEWQVVSGDITISGNVFTMPAGNVSVKAIFEEASAWKNPFIDVPAGAYYHDAVLWAAEKGIALGTDATHFSPDGSCTRAQAVTFLWRAAGCPTPKGSEMPFADVVKGSYYEQAVLWAVENGITNGTSAAAFSPDAICTRAQAITFLWRSQGMPEVGATNPFTDVASGEYYYNAVLWAVKNGITNGTSATTFSPDADCTRAQNVTFLYRCLSK